jgi:hypothetical protein
MTAYKTNHTDTFMTLIFHQIKTIKFAVDWEKKGSEGGGLGK